MNERELYIQGREMEKAGKLDGAVQHYQKALRENPAFRPALMSLGAIAAKLRRPQQSIEYYEKALRIKADEAVHFNLGSEYYQVKKYQESTEHLIACLKMNPRFLRAHILLAYVYEARKLPEKAAVYFKNALKLDPASRIAVLGLLLNLSQRKQYDDAIAVCDQYLKNKEDETVRGLRAGMLMESGDYDSSVSELQKLSHSSAGYRSFGDHIQSLRKNNEEESDSFFEGIRNRIGQRSKDLRARIEERKKAKAAGKVSESAAASDDAKDMMDLSLMYLFSGNPDKAMQFLVQAKKIKDRS